MTRGPAQQPATDEIRVAPASGHRAHPPRAAPAVDNLFLNDDARAAALGDHVAKDNVAIPDASTRRRGMKAAATSVNEYGARAIEAVRRVKRVIVGRVNSMIMDNAAPGGPAETPVVEIPMMGRGRTHGENRRADDGGEERAGNRFAKKGARQDATKTADAIGRTMKTAHERPSFTGAP